mgnify:CR=1 FL=1
MPPYEENSFSLITFALVIAVAGSGFWLVHYFIDSREQRQTYETLAEEFVLESTPRPNPLRRLKTVRPLKIPVSRLKPYP